MSNIRQRHWTVDLGFLIAGGFVSAAITAKSIPYGVAAIVIAALTLYIDRRNVDDEEHEIEGAHK